VLRRRGRCGHREGQEKEKHTGEYTRRTFSPYPLAWKMRGAELHEFLEPVGHKVWSFKGQQASLGAQRVMCCS